MKQAVVGGPADMLQQLPTSSERRNTDTTRDAIAQLQLEKEGGARK